MTKFADYRSWLKALYGRIKSLESRYSYAQFSKDVGLGSSNAHAVVQGKRQLTLKTAQHLIKALNLTGKQKRYLELLVECERAKDASQRNAAFRELVGLRSKTLSTKQSKKQFEFFRHWYIAAILELLRLPDASDDPEWIAQTLQPKVSLPNVKQAMKLLIELGYIQQVDGRYRPTEANISSGDEAKSMALMSFHHQMLDLAKQAIDTIPAKEREISSLTLSIPAEMKAEIKDEIVSLRKRLLHASDKSENRTEVVQVNFQMFGLGTTDTEDTE